MWVLPLIPSSYGKFALISSTSHLNWNSGKSCVKTVSDSCDTCTTNHVTYPCDDVYEHRYRPDVPFARIAQRWELNLAVSGRSAAFLGAPRASFASLQLLNMLERRTLTATFSPRNVATCTCARDAAAIGTRSKSVYLQGFRTLDAAS